MMKICLKDAMQRDFDRATLDHEHDTDLYYLLGQTDAAIIGWNNQQQPLEQHEWVWYKALQSLADAIRNTLNRRYGCND